MLSSRQVLLICIMAIGMVGFRSVAAADSGTLLVLNKEPHS
jgi:hypothetical protein